MLKNPYIKDAGRCSTPVYFPGESYSFVINTSEYFSDPDFANLILDLVDSNGTVIAPNIGELVRAYPYPGSALYSIYCTYPFPYGIPNGYFRFQIRNFRKDEVKLRSQPFLVENEIVDNTAMLEFWHEDDKYGVPYPVMQGADGISRFKQRVRLPLSQVDIQFESEKTTYRNASNRQLRTITSDRDTNLRIEARAQDEAGHEALSAVLEHDHIFIDGLRIEPKTALTIATNVIATQTKSTFDAYANQPDERHGIFGKHGNTVILCGNAKYPALSQIHCQ